MATKHAEQHGRRRFFTALFAGLGDVVSQAVANTPIVDAAEPEPATSAITMVSGPPLRRRNMAPSEIPDVRCM
jgi:hypothetical protein